MHSDTPPKDADTWSPTLRNYHQVLWSKVLPNGKIFDLTSSQKPPYYHYHSSDLGDFCLSSDAIIHTYSKWRRKSMVTIIETFPKAEIDAFYNLSNTIGSYILFPANKIEGIQTINQARGMMTYKIGDRFDLTLECIRRSYLGIENPLSAHINGYSNFFKLFENFQGYVNFFLLDDLIDMDTGKIRFWLPFTEFGERDAVPTSTEEYREYMKNASEFAKARNIRIAEWANINLNN